MKGDDIEAWEKLLENKEIREFMREISKMNFKGFSQIRQIRYGLENGLTIEQVKMYVNPEFYAPRMEQIRLALEHHVSNEKVKIIANEKYEYEQMEQIRLGFENGLTIEQVGNYSDSFFSWQQMEQIRLGCEKHLSSEKLGMFSKLHFGRFQMAQIRMGFIKNLSKEQVKLYANGETVAENSVVLDEYGVGLASERSVSEDVVIINLETTAFLKSEIEVSQGEISVFDKKTGEALSSGETCSVNGQVSIQWVVEKEKVNKAEIKISNAFNEDVFEIEYNAKTEQKIIKKK
jgi:DNA-binding transcriptional MerR regulator